MTALFAITTIGCGIVIFLLRAERSVRETALEELRDANRDLERRNCELANRLAGKYRDNGPQPGDFNRLQSIRGGRRG